jgi:photosystem II stability/assembly factor-like uncharacterized protein
MGLAVWSADGKKRWSDEWIKTDRKQMILMGQGEDTLVMADGMTVTGYNTANGDKRYQVTLEKTGFMQGGHASDDGRTVAVFSDTDGTYHLDDNGHVYVLRDGKLINRIVQLAQNVALTADGKYLAINADRDLLWYAADGHMEWSFRGDEKLHSVRISADGKRIVMATDLGTLYVLDDGGQVLLQRDFGSIPVAQWLADGGLLVATWQGEVTRLDAAWGVKWQVRLDPKSGTRLGKPLVADAVTTIKPAWASQEPTTADLTPNLLAQTKAKVGLSNNRNINLWHPLLNPESVFTDGKDTPPQNAWTTWTNVSNSDSAWTGKLLLQADAGQAVMKVTGVTFIEDPNHPETWVRDVLLQVFDESKGVFVDVQWLTADAARHTHKLDKPVTGSKFRFLGDKTPENPGAGGCGWPVGNLRLAELVFHGEVVAPPPATTKTP